METEEGEHGVIDLMVTLAFFFFLFHPYSLALSNTGLNNGDSLSLMGSIRCHRIWHFECQVR